MSKIQTKERLLKIIWGKKIPTYLHSKHIRMEQELPTLTSGKAQNDERKQLQTKVAVSKIIFPIVDNISRDSVHDNQTNVAGDTESNSTKSVEKSATLQRVNREVGRNTSSPTQSTSKALN